jgi:predicted acetyltransferase
MNARRTTPDLEFRPARTDADFEAFGSLVARSFAVPQSDMPPWIATLGRENARVAERGGRVAGCLALLPMGQWFGGRSVPMGAVVAVGIEPEERGLGAGKELMRAALVEMRARGLALSTLYPATQSFYRKAGYELAGGRYEIKVAAGAIGLAERDLPVRRLGPEDAPLVRAAYARAAAQAPGWLDRHAYHWAKIVEWKGEVRECYATGADGSVDGYLYFARRRDATGRHDVVVADIVALDARAGRRLLTFLADHRSMANEVSWFGGPTDPLLAMIPEASYRLSLALPWMLRVVDVAAAIEARGFASAIETEVDLAVEDALLPENSGRYRVRISGGRARVEPGGTGAIALDVRALAALYSGFHSSEALATLGLLEGAAAEREKLSAAFAGSAPTMPDMF